MRRVKRIYSIARNPRKLTEIDVVREKWELQAEEIMTDPWTQTNPRKGNGPEELSGIFELAKQLS